MYVQLTVVEFKYFGLGTVYEMKLIGDRILYLFRGFRNGVAALGSSSKLMTADEHPIIGTFFGVFRKMSPLGNLSSPSSDLPLCELIRNSLYFFNSLTIIACLIFLLSGR